MDGTKSLKGVPESSGFHPGRNYLNADGAKSQKWQGILPSAQELINPRCRGQQKVSIWSPSRQKFPQCRWKHHSNSDHSCQVANQWLPDRDHSCLAGEVQASQESFKPGRGTCFHLLSASVESDGARKASSATFFHLPDDYLNPNGLKNLVLSLFSIAQRLIENAMDRKKLLFQVCSIGGVTFSASMVKQGKWIPSTRKFSQRGWNERL